MLEERDEKTGKMLSDIEIQDNCYTFMIAGYETTATAIPICLYLMAQVSGKKSLNKIQWNLSKADKIGAKMISVRLNKMSALKRVIL